MADCVGPIKLGPGLFMVMVPVGAWFRTAFVADCVGPIKLGPGLFMVMVPVEAWFKT